MVLCFVPSLPSLLILADVAIGADVREEARRFEYIEGLTVREGSSTGSAVWLQDSHPNRHPEDIHVSFLSHGMDLSISASRHTDHFALSYKEVRMSGKNGTILQTKPGLKRCHYHGEAIGGGGKGLAVLSTCAGGIHGIFSIGIKRYEVHYLKDEAKHVMIDFDDYHFGNHSLGRCGVDADEHVDQKNTAHRERNNGNVMAAEDFQIGHMKHHRRILAAGECNSQPTKFVDLLLINDVARHSSRGLDTETQSALIFSYMHAYYFGGAVEGNAIPGIFDPPRFSCRVRLRLIGQLTYTDQMPARFEYTRGANCASSCSFNIQDSCGGNEISSDCLLRSFRAWVQLEKNGLEQIFGDIDNLQLLSEEDFGGSTIGLAWVGTMCDNSFSEGINQATRNSAAYVASTAAHEMGHNWGMSHDDPGTTGTGFLMNAFVSNTPASVFSGESKDFIDTFLINEYVGAAGCLEMDNGADRWQRPLCGNGEIDAGETCDPGYGFFDASCPNTCLLPVQCSASELCCDESGQFRPLSFPCRPARDNTCDMPEICTGTSGQCPTDLFQSAGMSCQDTTLAGVLEDGKCYRGSCITLSDNCQNVAQPTANNTGGSEAASCSALECTGPTGTPTPVGLSESGTPCGPSHQCLSTSASCVLSDSIKFYHYFQQTTPEECFYCRDEEGRRVADTLCETANPDPCQNSVGTLFPTPMPISLPPVPSPTIPPTAFPSPPPMPPPTSFPSGIIPTSQPTGRPIGPPTASPIVWIQGSFTFPLARCEERFALADDIQRALVSWLNIPSDQAGVQTVCQATGIITTWIVSLPKAAEDDFVETIKTNSTGVIGAEVTSRYGSPTNIAVGNIITGSPTGTSANEGGGETFSMTIILIGVAAVMVALIGGGILLCCCWRRSQHRIDVLDKYNMAANMRRGETFRTVHSASPASQPLPMNVLPDGWTKYYTEHGQPYETHHTV